MKKGPCSNIEKAYEGLKKAYHDLRDSHIEMVFRLALMAEYRDPTTGTHLVRIADYSAIIAHGLGLPKEEVDVIRYASPMHDVGKVMLSDMILKKTGKLTTEERKMMNKHPEVGATIFERAKTPMLKACGEIALSHHERFDGTGYPKGLKGEEIPLYGRIVALADCFDAYTSKRPYKEAFSFEKAVNMVKERSGTHFDPKVVAAFLANIEKIKKIWEANRDIAAFMEEVDTEDKDLKKI